MESSHRTLVIYTGGTFGMTDGKNGLTSAEPLKVSEELSRVVPVNVIENPSINEKKLTRLRTRKTKINNKIWQVDLDVLEFERLTDSSKMNQRDWEEIAECIKDHYKDYTGFVVVMGTDTMAYASSALSFMLENLSKPVVFTGAQMSIFDAWSDGPDNLLCSLIVSTLDIPEVLLCFNKKAFRASRVVKMDCVDFDAYASPNMPALVTLDCKVAAEEHGPLPPAVCHTASTHNRVPGTPGAVAAVALKGCFQHSRSCMLAAVGRNSLTEVEMPSQSGVDSPVPSSLDLVTSEKSSALILVTVLGIWGAESLSVSSDSRVIPLFQGVWPLLNCDLILLRSPFIVIVSDRTNEL